MHIPDIQPTQLQRNLEHNEVSYGSIVHNGPKNTVLTPFYMKVLPCHVFIRF